MAAFIFRRILLAMIVLMIVTVMAFSLIHLIPGDPVLVVLGEDAGREEIDALRHELWLDRPLVVQYGHWLSNALQGDFGKSIIYHEDVLGLIGKRLPVTLYLGLMAVCLSILIGIPAGIISAVRRGGLKDSVITVTANTGIAIPIFWLGILGIYLFGLKLRWLPIQGYISPFEDFWLSLKHVIMPVLCQSVTSIAVLTRQTRSSMLEVVRQDYVRTAWAKGLKERVIISRHALKNALIPVVTLLGLRLRWLIGGSVLIETVFNIPGIGRLLVSSVFDKDFTTVQAGIMVVAVVVVFLNLLVDISYGWLDPRIRFE